MSKNVRVLNISPDVTVLISYATPVAAKVNGKFLATSTFWSQTTIRHIREWLAGSRAIQVSQSFLDGLLQQ